MPRGATPPPTLRDLRAQLEAADHAGSAGVSLRVLQRYRRLILLGRIALPLADAQRVLGPDRAYHLYGLAKRRRSR